MVVIRGVDYLKGEMLMKRCIFTLGRRNKSKKFIMQHDDYDKYNILHDKFYQLQINK